MSICPFCWRERRGVTLGLGTWTGRFRCDSGKIQICPCRSWLLALASLQASLRVYPRASQQKRMTMNRRCDHGQQIPRLRKEACFHHDSASHDGVTVRRVFPGGPGNMELDPLHALRRRRLSPEAVVHALRVLIGTAPLSLVRFGCIIIAFPRCVNRQRKFWRKLQNDRGTEPRPMAVCTPARRAARRAGAVSGQARRPAVRRREIRTTTLVRANRAMALGMTIRLLNISVSSHTRSLEARVPRKMNTRARTE